MAHGIPPVRSGNVFWMQCSGGYRLPTEAEWEYACRAGTDGAFSCDEPEYIGSNCIHCELGTHPSLEMYCVYCANSAGETAPVASKIMNPIGLFDMHGNVWEWCWDWYGSYSQFETIDPSGPSNGVSRVSRGGGWNGTAASCRSAARMPRNPGAYVLNTGFRIVKPLESNTPTPTPVPPAMVYIPPGSFLMGSPNYEFCHRYDETLHPVVLTHGYYMQETEVIQSQWFYLFRSNPSYHQSDDCPVEYITFYDACVYCNRLSITEGYTPCYYLDAEYGEVYDGEPPVTPYPVYWKMDADGYRLPTEAEWEYACRARTETSYNNNLSSQACEGQDENLNPVAWYLENAEYQSHEVARKMNNDWQLYDMHGNVMEWCWDTYDVYPSCQVSDPVVSGNGLFHVVRGGSFFKHAEMSRSARRYQVYWSGYDIDIGFRPVRSVFDQPPTMTPSVPSGMPTYTPVPPSLTPTQTATSRPRTPSPTPPPSPTGFAYIPPGTFLMGSPPDEMCREDNELQHEVQLSHAFYIQQTEVTQEQWLTMFGTNPSCYQSIHNPVEQITWYDACVYCNRMSIELGLTPCYYRDEYYTYPFLGTPPVTTGTVYWRSDSDGYRLPTEAEWEYACRAGSTTAYYNNKPNLVCHGQDINLDDLAWYYFNHESSTAEVGLLIQNDWQLYDVLGNVFELCWDWLGEYSQESQMDPKGPMDGSSKIRRGGAFYYYPDTCRSAFRWWIEPYEQSNTTGFRPVISAD